MSITRRIFLRNSALAVVGTAAVPGFLTRAAFGAVEAASGKRLVVIFQRGAADGLNIVVPHGEPQYYAMRPSINIPRKVCDRSRRILRIASLARGRFSRCGSNAISPLCTLLDRPIRRAPISTRRILWRPARPA